MSGVFGVVDSRHRADSPALAKRMAQRLSHREWYVSEWHAETDDNVILGRIGIGVFNAGLQPFWNVERSLAVVMAGEIYEVDSAIARPHTTSDEQLVLALYEQYGVEFARHINGAFVCAVWDIRRYRLVIANDRFAFYPLYYSTQNARLVFAPEVKGILCDPAFKRKLDLTALAQYVRFQHLLGARTFFEDIRLLPPGSVLVCDTATAGHTLQTYWSFSDIPHRPRVSFADAVVETGRLLRRAVQRLSGDRYRPGVYLSGGLDSRAILGLIERRPVVSLTYGARDCRDVYYAGRIARAVGSDHHWFDFPDGNWVKEFADFHLELTEGFHSWIHAHGLSTLNVAREYVDLNLSGWDGGTVMGHRDSIEPLQTAPVDDAALTTHLFQLFNQDFTWPGITEAEEHWLYCPHTRRQVQGLALASFSEELKPYLELRPDIRAELFYVRNHCGRLTQNMITFYRSHMEMRFPFFDYALFEFLYSLPADIRGHRRLYYAVLERETPSLVYIPYDKEEYLPTSRRPIREFHALAVKLKRRLRRYHPTLFPALSTLYADYEHYLRHELRDWAEEILFDRRVAERGLFDPAFLRTLMARHCSGMEQWTIGKIAPLITYEMMLRRLCDDEPVPLPTHAPPVD
jgi:asparagine synthase (glutamine-hydrolysing)